MHLERALTEKTWPFMTVDGGALTTIVLFGCVILFGSIFLLVTANPSSPFIVMWRR
jgi:hypothetical protein